MDCKNMKGGQQISLDLTSKNPLLQYSEDDVRAVLARYDKTLESLEEDLKVINEWLDDQNHFPYKPCDREIVSFLVANRFCIEETKLRIQTDFTMKTIFPECYRFSTTDQNLIIFAKNYDIFPFPKLSPKQNRIIISRPENADLFNFEILTSIVLHIYQLRNIEDFAENVEYIVDLEKASAEMLASITPKALKKTLLILEKVYSNRIAAVRFINFHAYAESFLKLLKATFHPEVAARVTVPDKPEKLFEFYPKEILPKDLGGEERSLEELRGDWIKHLGEMGDYLNRTQHVSLEHKYFVNITDAEILDLKSDFK